MIWNQPMCLIAPLLASLLLPVPTAAAGKPAPADRYFMYVGTYTRGQSKGIYVYRFSPGSGTVQELGLAAAMVNPSFLTIHPNGKYLYAVSEVGNDGRTNGSVTAFAIDRRFGNLTSINTVSSGGGGSCHLVVDRTGKSLVVANYGSGSVAIFPLHADGSLGEAAAVIKHSGSSVNPKRQRGPHAHCVTISPDNRFVFVPDLGLDQVMAYRLDPAKPSLEANDPPFTKVPPGSGPRHFAFHPGGKLAYVVNEMGSSVSAFRYTAASGTLDPLQTISTLPADFKGEDNSAEIEVDRKGRFLYASNRGHDSIAVMAVGKDGKLSAVETVPSGGQMPRNFKLDPTGAYLFAANQNSNRIVLFRVDSKTGRLSPAGQTVSVGAPVCIQFVAE